MTSKHGVVGHAWQIALCKPWARFQSSSTLTKLRYFYIVVYADPQRFHLHNPYESPFSSER